MFIEYFADGFPAGSPPPLVGQNQLTVTWEDVVWAATTAGKPDRASLTGYGWHSVCETLVRLFTIYANLRQREDWLERSTLFHALDATEKGATSYFIGMTMAKLFASKLLGTDWLFHVSHAAAQGNRVAFASGRSRPDLIGTDLRGNWVVLEAKGRYNGLDRAALNKAKQQTRMIRTINGAPPARRIALQSYFSSGLRVQVDDPEPVEDNTVAIELNVQRALAQYYALPLNLVRTDPEIEVVGNRRFVTRFDATTGVTVGVDALLFEAAEETSLEMAVSRLQVRQTQVRQFDLT